ncbi:AMP-dependent synthetase/ligase [Patulibacter sp. NPDC049589]|uniref:AMP-dependent synthetase/ligase n=1 Tax=Patulibacter sp. NPDC049589 TaxID=3154731 RepID=UPI003432F12D
MTAHSQSLANDEAAPPEVAPRTIIDALRRTVERDRQGTALRTLDGAQTWTWSEAQDEVERLAAGLSTLGVGREGTVASMMRNRPEYVLADLAVVANGAAGFALYATLPPEQIAHQLRNSGATVVLCEPGFLPSIEAARLEGTAVEHVVVLDEEEHPDTISWAALRRAGDEARPTWTPSAATEDDVATVIYTSGTTGPSKGVELTHRNLLASAEAVNGVVGLMAGDRVISWLPNAHVAERLAHYYLPVRYGVSVTFCDDPGAVAKALPIVEPHWFFAVPRVWEKLRAAIDVRVSALPADERGTMRGALARRLDRVRDGRLDDRKRDDDLELLRPLRTDLGLGAAKSLQAGAAPCPREVIEFFHALGLPLTEIWGMSETTAAGTMSPAATHRIGTVGAALPGVELRLDADGEILVRGPVVTRGYRGEPEKTAEAFDDGWFRTGDVGVIADDGAVTIVDRKKELIINAAGKNMSPANIEGALKSAGPLIGQACVIGDARPYVVALLVLDPDTTPAWAREAGLEDASMTELATNPVVLDAVEREVQAANRRLARVEQIKRFHTVADEWLPGGVELTPTMKLKRKPIATRYAAEIDALYRP